MPKGRKAIDAAPSVYQLKITLLHSQPPIWRRLQVESGVTLARLHRILQVVMGWADSHMHGFRLPGPSQRGAQLGLVLTDQRGLTKPLHPTAATLRFGMNL